MAATTAAILAFSHDPSVANRHAIAKIPPSIIGEINGIRGKKHSSISKNVANLPLITNNII
jgi:hypothetical protein